MTQAFRAAGANSVLASPLTLTVPVTVKNGDLVLIYAVVNDATSTISINSNGPTQPKQRDFTAGVTQGTALFQFRAKTADAGATLTLTATNAASPLVGIVAAYSGCALVGNGDYTPFKSSVASLTIVSPALNAANRFGIAYANNDSGDPAYSQGTFRLSDPFTVSSLYDSNSIVNSTGGGTWTSTASGQWAGYTIALRKSSSWSLPLFLGAYRG